MRYNKEGKSIFGTSEGHPIMDGGSIYNQGLSMSEGQPIMDGGGSSTFNEADYWVIDGQLAILDVERRLEVGKPAIERESALRQYSYTNLPAGAKVEEPQDGDVYFTVNAKHVIDSGGHGGLNEGKWEKYEEIPKCPLDLELIARKNKGLTPHTQAWNAVEEIHHRRTLGQFGRPGPYSRRGIHMGKLAVEYPQKSENNGPANVDFIRDGTVGVRYLVKKNLKDTSMAKADKDEDHLPVSPGHHRATLFPPRTFTNIETTERVQYCTIDGPRGGQGMYQTCL